MTWEGTYKVTLTAPNGFTTHFIVRDGLMQWLPTMAVEDWIATVRRVLFLLGKAPAADRGEVGEWTWVRQVKAA